MSFTAKENEKEDVIWWWHGLQSLEKEQLYMRYRERFTPRIPHIKSYADFTLEDVTKIYHLESKFIAERQIDRMFTAILVTYGDT